MGKRGPKPKPKQLNILEGNPSRRPIMPDDMDISPDLPAVKPREVEMDEVASQEWDRLLAAMPDRLYTAADIALLSVYVQSWSMLWQAQAEIAANGITIIEKTEKQDGEGNYTVSEKWKTNPALAAWRTATENLHKAGDRLGLNPSVRARMGVPAIKDGPGRPPKDHRKRLIAQ